MEEIAALRAEVARLRAELAGLRAVAQPSGAGPEDLGPEPSARPRDGARPAPAAVPDETATRRGLLKVAAAGVVAGTVATGIGAARPAVASTGEPVLTGQSIVTDRQMRVVPGTSANYTEASTFADGQPVLRVIATHPAGRLLDGIAVNADAQGRRALVAQSTRGPGVEASGSSFGVLGIGTVADSAGVEGRSELGVGVSGVSPVVALRGSGGQIGADVQGSFLGLSARSDGTAVRARSAGEAALRGEASADAVAVRADSFRSPAIVATSSLSSAVQAAAATFGVDTRGFLGALKLRTAQTDPGNPQPQPAPAQRDQMVGELGVVEPDDAGHVWLCVAAGQPGTWRTLGGPGTAGAFYPIAPQRVYDSRHGDGRMAPNTNRTVSVADGIDSSGAVVAVGAVPPTASAVACNVTVSGPTGPNFLSVVPGGATGYTTSTINFPGGFDCANGSVCLLGPDRTLTVFCGDQPGSTHVIIDVTGFYA